MRSTLKRLNPCSSFCVALVPLCTKFVQQFPISLEDFDSYLVLFIKFRYQLLQIQRRNHFVVICDACVSLFPFKKRSQTKVEMRSEAMLKPMPEVASSVLELLSV